MGNVVSAGIGQAPARQASKFAGLPNSVVCTTVNKVCASGMKSAMMGAQSIALGQSDIVITGGMESMSNIPHYMPGARGGVRLGNASVIDGIVHDGLWDIYNNQVCYGRHQPQPPPTTHYLAPIVRIRRNAR
mmetsp:Transcript_100853/g.289478  ORF Transcript_100853/g.289478 Transcript_100853/m.289478 type:complete len:132 (-) Transcript_100853:881-1276(-)